MLGLAGTNNWDMARADMIVDGIFDMWGHLNSVYMPKLQGDMKTAVISLLNFRYGP